MKKSYSDLLKDPRWQKKRLEILQRDNFKCKFCEDSESTLHVHHLDYSDLPWTVEDKYLLTLCERCHTFVHAHGDIIIIDGGVLSPIDFLLLRPGDIYCALLYIENYKGLWTIQFREQVNAYQIINISCLLYKFIKSVDNQIEVRIQWPDSNDRFSHVDIYSILNDIS